MLYYSFHVVRQPMISSVTSLERTNQKIWPIWLELKHEVVDIFKDVQITERNKKTTFE